MPGIQQVSFTSPYTAEEQDIARRRQLAELLQAKGQEGLGPTEMVGGWAIPKSPLEGLGKAAQQVSGAYQAKQLREESKALGERYQSDLARTLMQAQTAGTGSPAVASQMYEDASGNASPTDARAAVAPNQQEMARILMGHPGTAPLGMAQMGKQMELAQRQQMLSSIMGGQGGQGTAPKAGAAGAPGGGPMAGVPPQIIALMTSGDPELVKLGTTLMEANKGIAQRPGAPVVNPFTGAVIAQAPPSLPNGMALGGGGPNGFTAAPVPGFAAAQAGIHEIPNASTPPVKLQTSGGQTIELSQPEYVAWQKTGTLPARYGGQQPQSVQPPGATAPVPAQVSGQAPNEAAAIAAINQNRAAGGRGGTLEVPAQPAPPKPAGLGVVGATQPQEEQIRQQREAEEAKAFGRERGQLLAAKPQAEAGATASIQSMQRVVDMAKELHDHEGLSGVTGKVNQYSIGDVTPTTRAARGIQDSLVNQVGVNALQAMRDASKTGGAVGAVTEKEWPILQQSIAALSAAQGTSDYQKALVNLQTQIKQSMGRIKRAYEQNYGENLSVPTVPHTTQGRTVEGLIKPFSDPAQEQRYQEYRRANGG